MIIIGIDIGYHNMAMVVTETNEEFDFTVKSADLIDITKIPHKRVCTKNCKIPHTREVADMMAHFIQEYGHILEQADTILVERQPPTGLTQIETLLLYLYRSKTTLISPNAMHSHLGINHYEYDRRKVYTVGIADKYLCNFEKYSETSRKHDMADAVCFIIFYLHPMKEKARLVKLDRTLPFHTYKYEGSLRTS
jgi:hypothetical protein